MKSVRLNEIYQTYKDDFSIYLIYVREAHPADGWQTPQNLYEEVIYDAPTSIDERAEIGQACQIGLKLDLPMLNDTIDDEVENKYVAAPVRLYVIDPDGKITFAGGVGPRDYDLDAWEQGLKEQLAALAG